MLRRLLRTIRERDLLIGGIVYVIAIIALILDARSLWVALFLLTAGTAAVVTRGWSWHRTRKRRETGSSEE